jgi:hypothetical protein
MTGRLRPNRTVRPTSKQPPMRYIRYTADVPEASAELVDLGTQPVVPNVRTWLPSVSRVVIPAWRVCTGSRRRQAQPA